MPKRIWINNAGKTRCKKFVVFYISKFYYGKLNTENKPLLFVIFIGKLKILRLW